MVHNDQQNAIRSSTEVNDQTQQIPDEGGPQQEYIVDRVVKHIRNGHHERYLVRWYGHTSQDDMIKPHQRISEHFINPYWENCQKWKITHNTLPQIPILCFPPLSCRPRKASRPCKASQKTSPPLSGTSILNLREPDWITAKLTRRILRMSVSPGLDPFIP